MFIKKDSIRLLSLVAAFLFSFSVARAQCAAVATQSIIPQIVDGGAWITSIALTNTGASQETVSLTFFQENGGGATLPWNLTFAERNTVQVQALTLQSGSTLFLHTLGNALVTSIGWGQLTQPDGCGTVTAYAIFTQRVAGRSDQDGTAPAATAATRVLVPFDNTNGAVTSIAIANPTSLNEAISVGIRTPNATSQAPSMTLPPQGHMSFDLPTTLPGTAAISGLVEFYSASGTFSILALRFNSGAFTTSPVYNVVGSPIIIKAP